MFVQGELFGRIKTRTRSCYQCGGDFSYDIGRGTDSRYCSDFCRTKARHQHKKARPLCTVDGCLNRRDYSGGLCNSCYIRWRRTGTTERKVFAYRWQCSTGYIKVVDKLHPLASRDGSVFEHRKVLWDAIGAGPHACHWCQTSVDWVPGASSKGALVVDHLDGDKANNQRTNLVAACNPCNSSRGLFMSWVTKHRNDPVLWAMYQAARVTG